MGTPLIVLLVLAAFVGSGMVFVYKSDYLTDNSQKIVNTDTTTQSESSDNGDTGPVEIETTTDDDSAAGMEMTDDGNTDNVNLPDAGVVTVSGTVTNVTEPQGPMDAPKTFVFNVRKSDGSSLNVSYTAYPPSPYGNEQNKKITLEFYAGTVKTGDLITAKGTYNKDTNTLSVASEGDFIKTTVGN